MKKKPTASRTRIQNAIKKAKARIRDEISRGILSAGDRMQSIRELCDQYSVSQKIINKLLSELKDEGIIEAKARSGCFVTEQALEIVQSDHPGRQTIQETDNNVSITDFFKPCRADSEVMTIYVTELEEDMIQLWRDVVTEYCHAKSIRPARILSCRDGHPEELFEKHSIDLIHTNSIILKNIGYYNFVNLKEVGVVDEFQGSYHDFLLNSYYLRNLQPGIPFSMTLHYLFINNQLFEKTGYNLSDVSSLLGLLKCSRELSKQNPLNALIMIMTSYLDLPLLSGSLSVNDDGHLDLDEDRLLPYYEIMFNAELSEWDCNSIIPEFKRGNLLLLNHCSYTVAEMKKLSLPFPWEIIPFPAEIPIPVDVGILAVSRKSKHLVECADLIRQLMSQKIQHRFAQKSGFMSVLKEIKPSNIFYNLNPDWTPEKVLDQHGICDYFMDWRIFENTFMYYHDIMDMNRGMRPAEQSVKRLRNNLKIFNASR